MEIQENIAEVKANIKNAKKYSSNPDSDITLVAVSKTKPVEMLMEAYNTGVRDFGENYVQELVEKIEIMPKDIRWHMIGHLQRNKVKYIVGKVHLIHSVDSLRLAEEISKESVKKDVVTDILLEVNIALEETKFGITKENCITIAREVSKLPNIRVRGLMTSAPFVANQENNRKFFNEMKQLSVDINGKNIDNISMDYLSMGMTNDYVVAVEEGSNMVRVGTAIFGQRNYNK